MILRFSDRGPGYPESLVDGGRSEGHLGLELVRGIVSHSLGGELDLSNEGGAAATLRFRLLSA